jgi:hypothetical protein
MLEQVQVPDMMKIIKPDPSASMLGDECVCLRCFSWQDAAAKSAASVQVDSTVLNATLGFLKDAGDLQKQLEQVPHMHLHVHTYAHTYIQSVNQLGKHPFRHTLGKK